MTKTFCLFDSNISPYEKNKNVKTMQNLGKEKARAANYKDNLIFKCSNQSIFKDKAWDWGLFSMERSKPW